MSTKKVRTQIEKKLECNLLSRKKEIDEIVMNFVNEQPNEDEEDSEEESEEETPKKKAPAKPKPAKKTPNKRKKSESSAGSDEDSDTPRKKSAKKEKAKKKKSGEDDDWKANGKPKKVRVSFKCKAIRFSDSIFLFAFRRQALRREMVSHDLIDFHRIWPISWAQSHLHAMKS